MEKKDIKAEEDELQSAQLEELDRRMEAYRADPTAGDSWEVVKARIAEMKNSRAGRP
jgi:putative addiction module component (TIGR02574 family)